MKLYVTEYSPFAHMARIVVREKPLRNKVQEAITKTRMIDSSYYVINPSGRVPYLVNDDGNGIEGSQLICDDLDNLENRPTLRNPNHKDDLEFRRLEEYARSLTDGLSIWIRELLRPPAERFEPIIQHERERSRRLLRLWDSEINHEFLQGEFNMVQLTLACALYLEQWHPSFDWWLEHPKLAAWLEPFGERPSFQSTIPPLPCQIFRGRHCLPSSRPCWP